MPHILEYTLPVFVEPFLQNVYKHTNILMLAYLYGRSVGVKGLFIPEYHYSAYMMPSPNIRSTSHVEHAQRYVIEMDKPTLYAYLCKYDNH